MTAENNFEGGWSCRKLRYKVNNSPLIVHACPRRAYIHWEQTALGKFPGGSAQIRALLPCQRGLGEKQH